MAQITHLNSRECREYLYGGGDLAVLPVGSVERLGPHLPLGARGMVAETVAELLAERNHGLCLPLSPYSTLYDTYDQPGSVDIPPGLAHRYFYDVCDELVKNRFRRILVVAFPSEFYYLANEYFQNENVAVVWMTPDAFYGVRGSTAAGLDAHGRELWRLAACLRARGDERTLGAVLERAEKHFLAHTPAQGKSRARMIGEGLSPVPEGGWLIRPVNLGRSLADSGDAFTRPDAALLDQAKDELLRWLDGLAEPIAAMGDYQRFIETYPIARPL